MYHAILFPNTIVNSAPAYSTGAVTWKGDCIDRSHRKLLKLRNLFFLASPFDIHLIVNTPRELRRAVELVVKGGRRWTDRLVSKELCWHRDFSFCQLVLKGFALYLHSYALRKSFQCDGLRIKMSYFSSYFFSGYCGISCTLVVFTHA